MKLTQQEIDKIVRSFRTVRKSMGDIDLPTRAAAEVVSHAYGIPPERVIAMAFDCPRLPPTPARASGWGVVIQMTKRTA